MLIPLLFFGCQIDEVELPSSKKSEYQFKKISLEEVKSTAPEIIDRLNKLKSQDTQKDSNPLSRIVKIHDFEVDTENVYFLQNNNYRSYTFLITREGEKSLTENLVLSSESDGTFNEVIFGYELTKEEQQKFQMGLYVDFAGKIFVENLVKGTSATTILSRGRNMALDCLTEQIVLIPSTPCDSSDNHEFGTGCTWEGLPEGPQPAVIVMTYNLDCINSGSGGATPGNGGSPGGGGLTPVVTVPVFPSTKPVQPCIALNKKSQNPIFKNKVDALNTPTVLSQPNENGFAESRNAISGEIVYSDCTAEPRTHKLIFPTTHKMIGYVHTHQNDYITDNGIAHTVKIFSTQDLFRLIRDCKKNAVDAGLSYEDAYGIMISSHDSFAIKILDPATTIFNTNWTEFGKEYEKKVEELVDANKLSSINLQIMFLRLLSTHGLSDKVGLFIAAADNLTEWNRVQIQNGDRVVIPCK
ncbi:hypothetical protein [Flavobacterium tegetincola]|uniref:hypothetical protein n=1 Tax=Flavobacterium tegetincola TaxID=150172 RepID=UPI000427FAA0|nr:hypothetical protein [Flavobacterium tegetincola]